VPARSTQRPRLLLYLFLAAFALYSLFPVLWTLVTSFKPEAEAVAYPPRLIPANVTLANYVYVLTRTSVPLYVWNTFVVSGVTVALVTAASALAGYAFARFKFHGRNLLLLSLLICVMVSGATKVIPLYLMLLQVGLLNSYWSLILTYSAELIPLGVWLMKSYIDTIPIELDEAALIDGSGKLHVFFTMILPLSVPGILAVGLMTFVRASQEFIYASTFISEPTLKTAPVGLYVFFTDIGVQWGNLTAASLLVVAPMIAIFVLLQRWFTSGLTVGAVK
jgi:multiple sugar transport system permease protein